MAQKFDYKFIIQNRYGEYVVKGVVINGYERSSVLAGQDKICWINSYKTYEAAKAAHPDAATHNAWTAPQNYFNHLPDEGDY